MDTSYILLFIAIFTSIYYYLILPFNYWKKQGVESASNTVPGFGNVLSVLTLRESISTVCNRLYNSCSSSTSMIGMFFMKTPMLIIRDPELIKCVLVKDFQSFRNNITQLHDKYDPFMAKNPFFSTDQVWKESRAQLINSMSLRKLKIFFRIMHEVSVKFESYLDRIIRKDDTVELELKGMCTKFTGELVANTAFGINGHSFEANPDPQSFIAIMEKFFESTLMGVIRQTLSFYLPNVSAALKISFMPKEITHFLKNTLRNTLQYRKENNVSVEDFLQITLEGVDKQDEDVIAGHISSYLFDAYETSASVAAFVCYKLSYHPDIQKRASEKIKETLDRFEGTLSYDALKDMTYLDQIVYETLRLYPIMGVTLKVCTQKITLEGSDGQKCCLKPGHLLGIPVQSLHMDNKYWKDPSVFDPDRFSEERKNEVNKFIFLPFSEGPRMCAGMRYGMMVVKTILVTILRKYVIVSSSKMKSPLKLDEWNFLTSAEGGLWAKLKRIDE